MRVLENFRSIRVIVPRPFRYLGAWGKRSAESKRVNVLEMKYLRNFVGVSQIDRVSCPMLNTVLMFIPFLDYLIFQVLRLFTSVNMLELVQLSIGDMLINEQFAKFVQIKKGTKSFATRVTPNVFCFHYLAVTGSELIKHD